MKNQLNKVKKETGANKKAQNKSKVKGKEESISFINN